MATGIVLRRGLKAELVATPPVEGELVYATDTDEFGYVKFDGDVVNWTTLGENSVEWGNIQGFLDNQIDLKDALALKSDINHTHLIDDISNLDSELNSRYLKTDFIDHKTGISGQPVKTNSNGLIDNTLIESTSFTLKGQFTPEIGSEYPEVSGLVTGDFFLIINVDENNGYTYQTGELQSETVFNNDQLTYSTSGWMVVPGNVNPDAYLRRDGTTSMFGDIDVNNHLVRNVKNPEDPLDAVNQQTLQAGLDLKSNIGHSHNPGNGSEIEYEPYDSSIQTHISLQDGSNPHKTKFVTLEDTPVSQDTLKPYLGYKGMRVTVNDSEDGLIFEPSAGNSILSADYYFDNETVDPAGQYDKQVRTNNSDFSSISVLYVSKLDRYLNDRAFGIESLQKDDLIGFRDSTDSSYMIFVVNTPPTTGIDSSYYNISVTPLSASGETWLDGAELNVEIFLTGEKKFNDLHDTPETYANSQYLFPRVKSTEDGLEFNSLSINDIGMVDISGDETTNPSILQQKLNERVGGSNRVGKFILNTGAALVTEGTDSIENILKYSIINGTTFGKTSSVSEVKLGDPLSLVSIDSDIKSNIKLNNNISISSNNSSYDDVKSLVKLNSNNDLEIGDFGIKSFIRSENDTLNPIVRKGSSGAEIDYMIHTDEGFTYQNYYDTRDLALQNEANVGTLSNLTTDAQDNIVNAINEVDSHIDNHIAQIVGNPHNVTKSDVGLGNCDNTADLDKPISNLARIALDLKADYSFVDDIGITINDGSITTNNVIKWTKESVNLPPFGADLKYVDISQDDQGIKLSGTIISDILVYNDFSIKGLKENASDLTETVNLIKRTTTSTGNFYKNNDVQVGDKDVQTVLYSTEALNYGLDPVVRKYFDDDGSGNPGTKDFRIYTTEQYNIDDYALITYVDSSDSTLQTNIDNEVNRAKSVEGTLSSLTTDAQDNIVNAINEVDSHSDTNATNIGTLSSLTTDAQDNIVNAINEVDSHSDTNATNIGTLSSLTTDAQTDLVSAINEVDSHSDTNATNIGTLSSLTTDAQDNIVNAINEIDSHIDNHTSDSSIHFTINKEDFDPADSDTTVVISGKVLNNDKIIDVFVNGTLKRITTDYSISDDGTDTTITFVNSFVDGDWVRVNYII